MAKLLIPVILLAFAATSCATTMSTGATTVKLQQVVMPAVNIAHRPAASVSQFHKFEAEFTLPDQTGNPYNPAENAVDVLFHKGAGSTITVPAFWDGDRWRVRFAPPAPGTYTLQVRRNGKILMIPDLSPAELTCTSSKDPGNVTRDARNPRRLVFDRGGVYYPLGMDVAWAGGKDADYPQYFMHMKESGMNFARVWMTFWDGKALEWSADGSRNPARGTFLMDSARRWDMVFDEAEKNGVYVQMVLQHHGQYTAQTDPNWSSNPFNKALGGFLPKPDDFFTDAQAKELTRAKYRYIVARWGYSSHLLAFELFNEVQNISETASHFDDVVQWHKEMAAYLRSIDPYHHLITTSYSDPGTPFANIGLDYLQIHNYTPEIRTYFAMLDTSSLPEPAFVGEWGPSDTKQDMTAEFVHDGLWASMMAPSSGAGQFWYWDEVMKQGFWPLFASASGFVRTAGADRMTAGKAVPASIVASGPPGALSFAPPGSWAPTSTFKVEVPHGGQGPNLAGISSFIQGNGHRDMLREPIVFHLSPTAGSTFTLEVGTVAKAGAHPQLSLDDKVMKEVDFTPAAADHDGNTAISISVPSGQHTVSLFNTGNDWFVARRIEISNYAAPVAVAARADGSGGVFWAYARSRSATITAGSRLTLPGIAPGRYKVVLWDPWQGKELGSLSATATSPNLVLKLPGFNREIAGVATRL